MAHHQTLILKRREIMSLLNLEECIAAVKHAFTLHGERRAATPGMLGTHAGNGGFHIKAGLIEQGRTYYVAKVNANFPGNRERFGLPTIQGLILLMDGENGELLAVMDSVEITIQRTGAATAVAAEYLSRPDSKTITICGCGNQGRIQLQSILHVRPLKLAFFYDIDGGRARRLSAEFSPVLSTQTIMEVNLATAVQKSDICVTCTPSHKFFLNLRDVPPGLFLAAVGADSAEKQELDPELFVSNKIVVDILDQSAQIGDLHHSLIRGLVKKTDVYAELGEIVAGKKEGRTTQEEIIIFDSTGMALQDAAAGVLVYEKALETNVGVFVDFIG